MMHPASRPRGAMEGVSEPSKTPPRPPQVTVAAWMIMVGSVFVVLIVWDRIAGAALARHPQGAASRSWTTSG